MKYYCSHDWSPNLSCTLHCWAKAFTFGSREHAARTAAARPCCVSLNDQKCQMCGCPCLSWSLWCVSVDHAGLLHCSSCSSCFVNSAKFKSACFHATGTNKLARHAEHCHNWQTSHVFQPNGDQCPSLTSCSASLTKMLCLIIVQYCRGHPYQKATLLMFCTRFRFCGLSSLLCRGRLEISQGTTNVIQSSEVSYFGKSRSDWWSLRRGTLHSRTEPMRLRRPGDFWWLDSMSFLFRQHVHDQFLHHGVINCCELWYAH